MARCRRGVELAGDDAGGEAGVGGQHLVGGDHREAVAEDDDDRALHAGQRRRAARRGRGRRPASPARSLYQWTRKRLRASGASVVDAGGPGAGRCGTGRRARRTSAARCPGRGSGRWPAGGCRSSTTVVGQAELSAHRCSGRGSRRQSGKRARSALLPRTPARPVAAGPRCAPPSAARAASACGRRGTGRWPRARMDIGRYSRPARGPERSRSLDHADADRAWRRRPGRCPGASGSLWRISLRGI